MKADLVGERIRIMAGTPGVMLVLVRSATPAFATAAGGDPGEYDALDAAERQSLEGEADAGSARLMLTVREHAIEVSGDPADDVPPLLTWPA